MIVDFALVAWAQLMANLRRCLLALVGVSLGVGVLIALEDLGRLTQERTMSDMAKLGSPNIIRVQVGPADQWRIAPKGAREIERRLPFVREATADVLLHSARAQWGKEERENVPAFGVSPQFLGMMNLSVDEGRFLTKEDGLQPVAVVGAKLASRLGVEKRIIVDGHVFRVVGHLEKNPWRQANEAIFLPFEAALRRLNNPLAQRELKVKIDDLTLIQPRLQALRRFLETDWGVNPRTLILRYNQKAVNQVLMNVRILDIFLGAVSLTTLVLGGLGISNTIMASVAERTREIGVRRAVGARDRDILLQFIWEAFFLCLAGGVGGLILGGGLVAVISGMMPGGQFQASPVTALVALGLAVAIGLSFSLWPVIRASRQDVVQALRSV